MKKISILIGILVLLTLTGCTDQPTSKWYEVTDKYEENGNYTLMLDNIRTLRVENHTYNKVDIKDRVKVDDSTDTILDYQSREDVEEERQRGEMCAITLVIIVVIMFALFFVLIFSDEIYEWIRKDKEGEDK